MIKVDIWVTDQQLTISPNKTRTFTVGISAATALLAISCLFSLVHIKIPIEVYIALVPVWLLVVGLLWQLFSVLRNQVFVFDKTLGQVFLNNRPILAIAELQSVCIERSFYRHNALLILYLRTKSQVKIEIFRDGLFGLEEPGMRDLAQEIAKYVHINLVTPDSFSPGHGNRDISFGPKKSVKKRCRMPLLWRAKYCRKPLPRRAK